MTLIPAFFIAVLTVVGLLIIGAGIAGLEVGLLLMIPPTIACVMSFSTNRSASWPINFLRLSRALSAPALIAISISVIESIHIRRTRTPVQFVLQWGDVVPSAAIIDSWRWKEPNNLENCRTIVSMGRRMPVMVSRCAERLAEVGNPDVAIPLLEAALSRCKDEPWPKDCEDNLAEPVAKLRARLPVLKIQHGRRS